MEVEVAKITLSDTIPAQHQIMRQQKGVKTSKPAKHTSSRLVVVVRSSIIVRFLQTENSSNFRMVFHSVSPFLRSLVIVYNQFVPHKSPP